MTARELAAVRLAVPDDGEAVARVQVDSWRAVYAGVVPEVVLAGLSVEQRAAFWRGRIERPEVPERRLFVIEVVGSVVGFASTGPSRDDGAAPGTAEVYAIYLAPAAWGRGHGRALFAAAVGDLGARGFARVTLWVLAGNERGRRFYEAAGMRLDGGTKVEAEGGAELLQVRYALSLEDPARA
jgi:ribosomal protein S18 acetylase RimI-like enzyme